MEKEIKLREVLCKYLKVNNIPFLAVGVTEVKENGFFDLLVNLNEEVGIIGIEVPIDYSKKEVEKITATLKHFLEKRGN